MVTIINVGDLAFSLLLKILFLTYRNARDTIEPENENCPNSRVVLKIPEVWLLTEQEECVFSKGK